MVLIVETLIVSTLSNFNLGVILPAFFGVPLVFLALMLPKMQKGFLLFLKWLIALCYAIAVGIFLVCGFLMIRAASEGTHAEADAVIVLGAAVHGDKVTWVLENGSTPRSNTWRNTPRRSAWFPAGRARAKA